MLARLTLIAALLSLPAQAQLLVDGFETGTLLQSQTPPGQWGSVDEPAMRQPQTVRAELDGGHRGQYGLVIRDSHQGTSMGNTQGLILTGITDAGDRHSRFWFNPEQLAGTGTVSLVAMITEVGGTQAEAVFSQDPLGGSSLVLQCFDRLRASAAGVPVPIDGGWHLVEVSALGLGTDAGACEMYVDGVNAGRLPRDYAGLNYFLLVFGLTFGPDNLTGIYRYDDFAFGTERFASTVSLSGDDPALGECREATLRFLDSTGAERPLTTATRISFTHDDKVDGCNAPLAPLDVAAGTSTATISYRASTLGEHTITANADDLVPGTFRFIAGAGESKTVGCSCQSGGEALVALLGLLTLARRRPKSSACPRRG